MTYSIPIKVDATFNLVCYRGKEHMNLRDYQRDLRNMIKTAIFESETSALTKVKKAPIYKDHAWIDQVKVASKIKRGDK